MKDKIFQALKQGYSRLGLGDSILQAHAESLAALGLVTDENLTTVIDAQRTFLENLQKSNDKRVADAVAKVKADAAKDTNNVSRGEKNESGDEPPSWYIKDREASAKRMEERMSEERKSREASEKALEELRESHKKLSEGFEAMRKENAEMKKAKAKADRDDRILAKAKELGIPDWRVKEGFAISDEADEAKITEHLTQVANNIKAQSLPPAGGFPLSDTAPGAEEVKALAKGLVG